MNLSNTPINFGTNDQEVQIIILNYRELQEEDLEVDHCEKLMFNHKIHL